MCIFIHITKLEVCVSGMTAFAAKRILHSKKWSGLSQIKAQTYQHHDEIMFWYQTYASQDIFYWAIFLLLLTVPLTLAGTGYFASLLGTGGWGLIRPPRIRTKAVLTARS